MAKGIAYTKHLDLTQTKGVYEQPVENWNFLYETSTTKNPQYDVGDRVVLPDGRVFRYGKSYSSLASGQVMGPGYGACFYGQAGSRSGLVAATQALGDKSLTIASQTLTLDELRGGYLYLWETGDSYVQQRGIIGNTEVSNATVTIYLDAPLERAITTSCGVEFLPNPYLSLAGYYGNESNYASVAGVPTVRVATASAYFWIQTWGPCYVGCAEAGVGQVLGERQLVFNQAGTVRPHNSTYATTAQYQHAGFIIDRCASGVDSPPFIMLQISP